MGINQQTLANLAMIAVNTVVAIERGVGNPNLILNILGLEISVNLKQLEYERV